MTVAESFLLFSPVILLMAVLFVALWLGRAKRNRRTGMGRPFKDSRNWSHTYMQSLKQERY